MKLTFMAWMAPLIVLGISLVVILSGCSSVDPQLSKVANPGETNTGSSQSIILFESAGIIVWRSGLTVGTNFGTNTLVDERRSNVVPPKKQRKSRQRLVSFSFPAYDEPIVASIQKRWEDLIAGGNWSQRGKIVIVFCLWADGRVTDLRLIENEMGEELGKICEKAVLGGSPYPKWPDDIRRKVGSDFRNVTFTFYYD